MRDLLKEEVNKYILSQRVNEMFPRKFIKKVG